MKVFVNNTEVTLNNGDFLASGGEGQIFVKNRVAFKLYFEPSKMIPLGKIQELSAITNQNVIRPNDVIYNVKQMPIGYTMRFVPDTYALCQLFTKAFRERNGIDHQKMQGQIKNLKALIDDIHSKNILIVDLNEMNFLSNNKFDELYAIDTDSYQTRSYPATAIMESIRDRHSKTFSKETDWFSFGIISFQMFTGIHPFKGSHPTLKGFEERMSKNVSVFNKDVGVPRACYPIDIIPEAYKHWYRAVFEDGKRLAPPADFHTVAVIITTQIVSGSNHLDIELLQECEGKIYDVNSHNGFKILTDKRYYTTQYKHIPVSNNLTLFGNAFGVALIAKLDHGSLKVLNANNGTEAPVNVTAEDVMSYNNTLYMKSDDKIFMADVMEIGNKIIVSTKVVASVLENASKFYDGVLIQNLLGSQYVSMFSEPGIHRQFHIKELNSYRILDAKYDFNVLMVIGVKPDGKYDRLIFRFDKEWLSYDQRIVENITPVGLNFVVLDNGITICINENDHIEVFSNKKDSTNLKIVQDTTISSDMKLFKSGAKLLFANDNKLYSAKMK